MPENVVINRQQNRQQDACSQAPTAVRTLDAPSDLLRNFGWGCHTRGPALVLVGEDPPSKGAYNARVESRPLERPSFPWPLFPRGWRTEDPRPRDRTVDRLFRAAPYSGHLHRDHGGPRR